MKYLLVGLLLSGSALFAQKKTTATPEKPFFDAGTV
ncbi:MAG: hypothetical protein RL078_1110, partial [Bacteroidota bacterium]